MSTDFRHPTRVLRIVRETAYAYAKKRRLQHADADDVASVVVEDVQRFRRPIDSPEAMAIAIAKRRILDHHRRTNRHATPMDELPASAQHPSRSPEDMALAALEVEALMTLAEEHLSPSQLSTFVELARNGGSIRDAVAVLVESGEFASESAVRTHASRAIKKLQSRHLRVVGEDT